MALQQAARARGATRRAARGRTAQLQAELDQAKEAARSIAQLLLDARSIGQEVANALTEAKARDLHPKVCRPPMPAETSARIRDIANAIVSLEAAEKASTIVAGAEQVV